MGDAIAALWALLLRGLGLLAGVAIAALALLVTLDVTARNLGWFNLPWLIEVAEYGLFVSTLLAAPWVLHESAHVRVDLLVDRFSGKLRRGIDLGAELLGLALAGCLAWYGARVTASAWRLDEHIFQELVVKEWWLLLAVPVSGVLLMLEFARRAWRAD